VRRLRHTLSCTAALTAVAALVAASAAAAGTDTSAGNQQYLDPLTSSASSPSTPPGASAGGSSTSPQSPPASSAGAAAKASSARPSTSTVHDPGGTLPYTGLNVWPYGAVGIGLLGAGLVLRRAARRE
jgi:hypothetical protein